MHERQPVGRLPAGSSAHSAHETPEEDPQQHACPCGVFAFGGRSMGAEAPEYATRSTLSVKSPTCSSIRPKAL